MGRGVELVGVVWLVALMGAACSSATQAADGAPMPPDGASPDGASGDGASADGSSGGTCSADVPPGQACNALVKMGGAITPTCMTGTAPSGTGGTIFDGTYILTAQAKYSPNCTSPLPFAETIEIAGGCTQFVFGDILAGTGSARITTQGSAISSTQTCVHVDTDGAVVVPDMSMTTYTATGTSLTLFSVNAASGATDVSVFTRR